MTIENSENLDLNPNEFLEAFKKLQEGENTADELEHKLDLMEEKMHLLLKQLELVQCMESTSSSNNSSDDKEK